MFGALKRFFTATHEVETTVINQERSADGQHYTVLFLEDGSGRTYKHVFSWYGPNGFKAPKPRLGEKAILHVNWRGRVVYAGSANLH